MSEKTTLNISGIGEGLKNTEVHDVNFVQSPETKIQTLHISWDTPPKPEVHQGIYILATELGAPDPEEFEKNLLRFFYSKDPETKILNAQFIYSLSLDPDDRLKALWPAVKRVMRRYDANLGAFEDSMLGIRSTFKNMDLILRYPDISTAKCSFKNALLLSAGPSLDAEWGEIKRAYDSGRYFLIACDVVLKRALKEGVKPHLVVTTERVTGSEDFFKGLTEEDVRGVTLCSTLMAHRPVLDLWPGRLCFVVRRDYPSSWYGFKDRRTIWSAPSVAPTCLGILGLLRIKKVALVGQDLCLNKEGQSHAEIHTDPRTAETKREMNEAEAARAKLDREEVVTYGGEVRRTTNAWNVMRGDLATVAMEWKLDVVSTSRQGARIPGIEYLSLKDFLADLETGLKRGFHLKEANPNFNPEIYAFRKQRFAAKKVLRELMDHLEEFPPEALIQLPHFRDLCLTCVQRAYVTYLNKRFQRNEDTHQMRTIFWAEAMSAMVEILEILENENGGE